jgi:hypothetical protein
MRTTVEIPDDLFHQIKLRVTEERVTLREFLVRAAERELVRRGNGEARRKISFPLVPSRHPGSLRSLTNAEIDELSD